MTLVGRRNESKCRIIVHFSWNESLLLHIKSGIISLPGDGSPVLYLPERKCSHSCFCSSVWSYVFFPLWLPLLLSLCHLFGAIWLWLFLCSFLYALDVFWGFLLLLGEGVLSSLRVLLCFVFSFDLSDLWFGPWRSLPIISLNSFSPYPLVQGFQLHLY